MERVIENLRATMMELADKPKENVVDFSEIGGMFLMFACLGGGTSDITSRKPPFSSEILRIPLI